MQHKFLKFFALVILIISSFFLGKHLIINAQSSSTLSVQESSVPIGGRVTVSWNIKDDIGTDMNDWIGLFTPAGSQSILFAYPTNMNSDGSPRNCVVTQTGFSVAGSCSFAVFAQGVTVDPGTYQLRYFHRINNVNTKVATSNNFNITSGSSDGNAGSVKIDCAPNSSTCGGAVARVFIPQNGCPSGNDGCQNSYKQEVTIPSGSTGVTVTNIPPGNYSTTIIKPGFVSDPPTIPISVGSTGTTTPSTVTLTLNVDTSEITGFSANPTTIDKGSRSTLNWQTKDFNVCSIDKGIGSIPKNGSKVITPTYTTTYTLSCINSAGTKKTKSVTVTVNGTGGGGVTNDPILTVGSSTVKVGETIKATWANVSNSTSSDRMTLYLASGGDPLWTCKNSDTNKCGGDLLGSVGGSMDFPIDSTIAPGAYVLKYRHYEGNSNYVAILTSNSFTVTSNTGGTGGGTGGGTTSDYSVKIDSFTVNPPLIKNGESSKITWQTTSTFPANVGRNYVTLNGEPVGEDGERTVEPNRTTNYTLKISRSEDSGAGASGSSCSATNLVPTKVDIYKNKPAIFANGYSRSLTLSGTGSNRKLTINQDFGFTSFSLANPSDPTILQHKNMTTNGNPPGGPFSKTGDGQTVVNGLRASLDGSRMIVGWSDVPDDFIVLKDFNGSWEVQAEGDGDTTRPAGIAIVKRTDGKYIGFEYNISGLFAADISDPLPTARGFSNGNDSAAPVFKTYTVPGTSSNPNTPVPQVSSLQQAGNYVAYPGDVDRTNLASMRNGNAIVLVDASKPLGSPNIASNFIVKRLSMADLGIPTTVNNSMLSTVINGFTITASQSDPDVIYLFVDTVKDSVPGAIYAYKISSSGAVVTPLAGSPANPPAPFVGTGVQSGGRPFAYTTANNSRAFFFRKTSSLMGFVNATVTGSTLSVNVATSPYSSSVLGLGLSDMQGFEENNTAYVYTAHGSFMNAWKINCNNSSPSQSGSTCTAPNCASAMRVVTVGNDDGGGTGTGGADDGTGRRTWFWWLKYYLNL